MSVIVKAVEKVVDTVVDTVKAVINDPLPTLLTIAGQAVGIPAYITQSAITAARGGDLEDIAKAAAISVATPTVAAKLAPAVNTAVSSVVTNEAAAHALTAATSQSLVAGSLTAATGGDWQQAAAGAFAGSMAASGYDKYVAPEVAAQSKALGLSAESHANVQGALKSGLAGGTGTVAAGGDFATGFAGAFVESGWDNLTAKASEGLGEVKDHFLKDKGVQDNQPTFAGIPSKIVNEVPMSLEGQLAQISSTPRSSEYGKQFGPALAADMSGGIIPYGKSTAKDVPIDVPEIDFSPYVVGDERSLPEVTVVGKKEPYEAGKSPSSFESEYSDILKKAAISGDTSSLSGATKFGQIPDFSEDSSYSDDVDQSSYLSARNVNRIISKANQSSAAAAEARLAASVAPTPENIAAAEQAELAAELDKKALDGLAKTDVPVDAAPTIEETNQNILNAILGGDKTVGAPTPVAGQTGEDLLTAEGLQQAGLGDFSSFEGAGGISDPIDGQTAPLGAMTSRVPMPQTMQPRMSGAPMPRLGAPMPQGGLQFSNFRMVGVPGYSGAAPSTLSALGPLSDLDMQSIMMMSPEEYAARTKSANIFRVARGGLIALKKQR